VDGGGEGPAGVRTLDDPKSVAMRLVRGFEHIVRIEFGTWCDRSRTMRTWTSTVLAKARCQESLSLEETTRRLRPGMDLTTTDRRG
jgi:hypothetical protein